MGEGRSRNTCALLGLLVMGVLPNVWLKNCRHREGGCCQKWGKVAWPLPYMTRRAAGNLDEYLGVARILQGRGLESTLPGLRSQDWGKKENWAPV